MERTGDWKEQAGAVAAKEESKAAMEEAGAPLTDDKLDVVSGGVGCPSSDVFPEKFDSDPFIRDNHVLMQDEDDRD